MTVTDPLPPLTFVNLHHDPGEGQDERRVFIRRRVMLDYHHRRKKIPSSKSSSNSKQSKRLAEQESLPIPSTESDDVEAFSLSSDFNVPTPTCEGVTTGRLPPSLEPYAIRLFRTKDWDNQHHAQIGKLMQGILKSQSQRAARDIKQVAFVHCRFRQRIDVNCSQDALSRCIRLLRSQAVTGPTGHAQDASLWFTVHEELEKIHHEIETLPKWELLSAAQAITLYILLWVREEGDCHEKYPHDNVALIFILGRTFKYLQSRHLHMDAYSSTFRPAQDWQDWIFQQSCLRVATIYFVLSLVINMDIGFTCDSPTDWNMEALPSPISKSLWDANDEASWRSMMALSAATKMPLTIHDLTIQDSSTKLDRESWESDLDDLGMIVGMALCLHKATINDDSVRPLRL